jgi:DNA-binding beta-propeller fold protein YncE
MTRTTDHKLITGLGASVWAAVLFLCAGTNVVGCSDDEVKPPPESLTINPAANASAFASPFDATPDSMGNNVYFTAIATDTGLPAVFAAPAAGGAPRKLVEGGLLVAPFGIAISADDKTLFIADSGTDNGEDKRKGGVLSIPVAGGNLALLQGTGELEARGLELDKDTLYFSGRGADGKMGVYKVPSAGGSATPIAAGAPFSAPSGIAVAGDGTVYVGDAETDVGAAVYKIAPGGAPELIKSGIGLGYPAGVALSRDGSTLFVSGKDPGKGTDVVYRINLASKETKLITDTVGKFDEAAGLHRAKGAEVFAWADRFANNTGTVYVLK